MDPGRVIIQQLFYDGLSYSKGQVYNVGPKFDVVCSSFPFVLYPAAKGLYEEDWVGQDGKDVDIPEHAKLEDYSLDAVFMVKGENDDDVRDKIKTFIQFLYGRNEGGSARLAIYDYNSKIGRKDVCVNSINNDLWWNTDNDSEKIAVFTITFHVYDPVTEVVPTKNEELGWERSL